MTTPSRGPRSPAAADLLSRIDAGIRERIEDAVDDACLTALVRARAAAGSAGPVADNADDRAEFQRLVHAFLLRLCRGIRAPDPADLPPRSSGPKSGPAPVGAAAADARTGAGSGVVDAGALLSAQVALAKEIPDYWQRLDAIRAEYVEEQSASGRERPGFLRRLFRG